MKKKVSLTNRIIGTITFNRDTLKDVAESDDATSQAWLILIVSILISAFLSALATYLNPSVAASTGLGSLLPQNASANDVNVLIVSFIGSFVVNLAMTLVFAVIAAFVGRGFGGKLSTTEVIRIMGFASVLTILSAIVTFIGSVAGIATLSTLSLIVSLWLIAVFVYGYSIGAEFSIVKAIIAIIIALIITVIVVFILLIILGIIFVAIFFSSAA